MYLTDSIKDKLLSRRQRYLDWWERNHGCDFTIMNPSQKGRFVKEFGSKFGLKVLVETGTYKGDTIAECVDAFDRIVSVELDEKLFLAARERFKNNPNVTIYHGDSGVLLPEMMKDIDVPCVFWLDAHYSGEDTVRGESDTPIAKELDTVFKYARQGSVLLIDDAKDFRPETDYPSLEELIYRIDCNFKNYNIGVVMDVVVAIPKEVA